MNDTVPTQSRYCRVYWQALDDPKFSDVWDDDHALSCWLRLLVAADMSWPSSGTLYSGVNRKALKALVAAGLVDMQSGSRYRIHGLDAERQTRTESARNAAAARWHSRSAAEPDAPAMRPHSNGSAETMRSHENGNAETMPSRAEQSRAEIYGSTGTTSLGDARPISASSETRTGH